MKQKKLLVKLKRKKGIGTAPADPNLKTFKKCSKIEEHLNVFAMLQNRRFLFPRAQLEGTLPPNPGRKEPAYPHT